MMSRMGTSLVLGPGQWARERGAIRAGATPQEAGAVRLDERRSAGISEAGRRTGRPSGCGIGDVQVAERWRRDSGGWRRPAVGVDGTELGKRTLGVVEAEPAVLVGVDGMEPREEEDCRPGSGRDGALHTRFTCIARRAVDLQDTPAARHGCTKTMKVTAVATTRIHAIHR